MSRHQAELRSSCAVPIKAFLEFKQALGCKYRTEGAALRLLDTYLAEHRITALQRVDSQDIDAFLASRPRERARSYNHLVGVIRRFFDWSLMQGIVERNPVTATSRRVNGQRIPYLFCLDDARRLLEAARSLRSCPRAPYRAQVYETAFALLYGLGLRVGEVSRLRVGDVRFIDATLLIRDTKFYKSRLVPFGPRIGERLARYVEQCHGTRPDLDVPLFSFTKRGAIHECTFSQTFHVMLPRLGLNIRAGMCAPRLHDLRHAFAVGTLLRWYRSGIDLNTRLLQLSTFLGHADPASTAVYLTITDELLQEADRRFRAYVPGGGQS
jgi:site-specific recombinase XerD